MIRHLYYLKMHNQYAMKLILYFQPCKECHELMNELSSTKFVVADELTRADESAKFLRHITYNHAEAVKAILGEVKEKKRSPEFDLYR